MSVDQAKRMYYLRVKPLYVEEQLGLYSYHRIRPLFCQCAFHDEIISIVFKLRQQLIDLGQYQISQALSEARWFFDLTNRYHQEVKSFINVTEKSVYITGSFPPYNEPHFQTSKIPIAELGLGYGCFKPVTIHTRNMPQVKALIAEIEGKESHLSRRFEQSYALDKLTDALSELDNSTVVINTDVQDYHKSLKRELECFEAENEKLEQEIQLLNLHLMYLCLNVQVGDWISSDVSRHGKMVQLVVESVDYSNGSLHIRGTNITKKGVVGKRGESLSIEVLKNEH